MSKIKFDQKNKQIVIDFKKVNQNKMLALRTEKDMMRYALNSVGLKFHQDSRAMVSPSDILKEKILKKSSKLDEKLNQRKGNYYLNLFQNSFKVGNQTVMQNKRYFGIEIECFIPFEKLGICKDDYGSSDYSECPDCEGSGRLTYTHRASGNGIEGDCPSCDATGEYYNADGEDSSELFDVCSNRLSKKIKEKLIKGVDIKEDGSLEHDDSDDFWPVEITILVPQDDFTNLSRLCSLLKELDATVNTSCGLHVHIDARDYDKKQVLKIGEKLESYLPFMKNMVSKSRLRSTYCKLQASSEDRYSAINLTSYSKYKTIEIRLHQGTTDFDKIKNWCLILKNLINRRKCNFESNNSFIKIFTPELQEYIKMRMNKFNPDLFAEIVNDENDEDELVA